MFNVWYLVLVVASLEKCYCRQRVEQVVTVHHKGRQNYESPTSLKSAVMSVSPFSVPVSDFPTSQQWTPKSTSSVPHQRVPSNINQVVTTHQRVPSNINQVVTTHQRVPQQRVPQQRVPQQRVPQQRVPQQRVPQQRVPQQRVPSRTNQVVPTHMGRRGGGTQGGGGTMLPNSLGGSTSHLEGLPQVSRAAPPNPQPHQQNLQLRNLQGLPNNAMNTANNIFQGVTLHNYPVANCKEMTWCDDNNICKCERNGPCRCVPVSDWPEGLPIPARAQVVTVQQQNLQQNPNAPGNNLNSVPEIGPKSFAGMGSTPGGFNGNSTPPPPAAPVLPPELKYEGGDVAQTVIGRFSHLSDPMRLNQAWCWKLALPVSALRNWGWLVEYAECNNPNSDRHQKVLKNTVCIETGGMEFKHDSFDPSFPFKGACIDRNEAIGSEETSCWKIAQSTIFEMRLQRVRGADGLDTCNRMNLPHPFSDKIHTSSRFSSSEGGIGTLYKCNGNRYNEASVRFKLDANTNAFMGYEEVACLPRSPQLNLACEGVGFHCLSHLEGGVVNDIVTAMG